MFISFAPPSAPCETKTEAHARGTVKLAQVEPLSSYVVGALSLVNSNRCDTCVVSVGAALSTFIRGLVSNLLVAVMLATFRRWRKCIAVVQALGFGAWAPHMYRISRCDV